LSAAKLRSFFDITSVFYTNINLFNCFILITTAWKLFSIAWKHFSIVWKHSSTAWKKLLEVRWETISSSLKKVGRSLKVGVGKLNAQCAVASKKQRLG
jgi:hypothetical protein